MDLGRLSLGQAVTLASGLALFVFMFLPWYRVDARGRIPGVGSFDGGSETLSAWQAFTLTDLLLLAVFVLTVGLTLAAAAGVRSIQLPERPAPIVLGAGLFAVLLILYRLLNTPGTDVDVSVGEVSLDRRIGIFLSLLAAAGIALGGYLGSTERQRPERRRRRPVEQPGAMRPVE